MHSICMESCWYQNCRCFFLLIKKRSGRKKKMYLNFCLLADWRDGVKRWPASASYPTTPVILLSYFINISGPDPTGSGFNRVRGSWKVKLPTMEQNNWNLIFNRAVRSIRRAEYLKNLKARQGVSHIGISLKFSSTEFFVFDLKNLGTVNIVFGFNIATSLKNFWPITTFVLMNLSDWCKKVTIML